MAPRKPINPFYVLLVLAGIAFFITASAYGVMTVKGLYPDGTVIDSNNDPIVSGRGGGGGGGGGGAPGQSRLLDWLDENGFRLLMVEIVILAIFTFAAIGTDSYWSSRDKQTSLDRKASTMDNKS